MTTRSILLALGLVAFPVAGAIAQNIDPSGNSMAKGTTTQQSAGEPGKSTGPAAASSNSGASSTSGDVKSTNTTPPGRTSTGLPSEKQPR